jgi:NADH-quinone oxidoreductase subunit A
LQNRLRFLELPNPPSLILPSQGRSLSMSPTSIVAYLLLFASVGFLFVFGALLFGWLLRPKAPAPEKLETYECGEPTVGSSFVQFDLRFYVVALVFIIFDVEVAFFFPWAAVFGKATQMRSPGMPQAEQVFEKDGSPAVVPGPAVARELEALGVRQPTVPQPQASVEANSQIMRGTMRRLAQAAMVDIAVFFAVLMVGFAYVWSRGDLDWVRAVGGRSAGLPVTADSLAVATSGEQG